MQQADRADSATGALASPGNIENHFATRRGMLGLAAGVGAVAIALPISAISVASRPWDIALHRYRIAKAAADRFRSSDYDPAWRRIDAAAGSRQISVLVRAPGLPARKIPVERSVRYPAGPEYDAARGAQTALQLWWDRRCAAEDKNREIIRRQESLWTEEDAARQALMGEPAPDAAALAVKILLAFEEEEIWAHEREALAVDARRLAS